MRFLKLGVILLLLVSGSFAADDDIYLDQETFSIAAPPVELRRPDKDWLFIDVAKQRAAEAKSRPSGDIEAEFDRLEARLHCAPLRALVSVYVERLDRAPPPVADIEANVRKIVASRKGEVVEAGRVLLGTEEAVKVDYLCAAEKTQREAKAGAPSVFYYSRIDCPRPKAQAVVTLFFEAPKERIAKAKPAWLKLLKRLKLS
jgi:hypothetical protein